MISNINFEYSVISTLLFDSRAFYHIQDIIEPSDFIDEACKAIFEMVETKIAIGEAINESIILDALPNYANLIAETIVPIPALDKKTAIDISKKISDFAKRRRTMMVLNTAMNEIKEGRAFDLSELNEIEQGINNHTTNEEIIAIMEDRLTNKVESAKTGIKELDKFFTTSPGDAIVIAARPSMGKTSLVATFIWSFIDQNEGSLFLSLEMPSDNIMLRMISSRAEEPISNIKHSKIRDINRYQEVKEFLRNTDLFEMSDIAMDETQIVHYVKQRFRKNPKLKHVFLDHLTFTKDSGRYKSEHLRIAAITKAFKILAKELGIRFWMLSQLSRSIESRPNKRPQLADLRESGAIEENADAILFIYREQYYVAKESGEKEPPQGPAEIGVGKFRDGPTGTAHCTFNGPLVKFQSESAEVTEYVMDVVPADMNMSPTFVLPEKIEPVFKTVNQATGEVIPHPNDFYPEEDSDKGQGSLDMSNEDIITMPVL